MLHGVSAGAALRGNALGTFQQVSGGFTPPWIRRASSHTARPGSGIEDARVVGLVDLAR
jgi:hypothetical protein